MAVSTVIVVPVSARGQRIGQYHQCAKLTDREVELLLQMRESGLGWRKLSAKFGISCTAVKKICTGITRSQTPTGWRTVHLR